MAIRFACANCGKYHRIADQHAGRAGRCGRCGTRFIAPGNPQPSPSPIFVPAAAPNLYPAGRRRKRRSGAGTAIFIGLLLGIIALFVVVDYRDQIAAALPGVAPALPPKAAPRPVVITAPAAPTMAASETEWKDLATGLQVAYVATLIFGGMIAPVVVPPVLSRRGLLSVGRWLIMGATVAILALGNTTMVLAFQSKFEGIGLFYGAVFSLLTVPLYFAFVGCFLAAAIHPKSCP